MQNVNYLTRLAHGGCRAIRMDRDFEFQVAATDDSVSRDFNVVLEETTVAGCWAQQP